MFASVAPHGTLRALFRSFVLALVLGFVGTNVRAGAVNFAYAASGDPEVIAAPKTRRATGAVVSVLDFSFAARSRAVVATTALGAFPHATRSNAIIAPHGSLPLGGNSKASFGQQFADLQVANSAPQGPHLTITKSHTGNFIRGQTGATYTITVTNAGTDATIGTVTVTDTLPTGLTVTGLVGTGWGCAPTTLTCTRVDALAAAASYPVITLTVTVASDAPISVVNTATVSGGGDTNTSPSWQPLAPSGALPSARVEHTTVYDPGTNTLILYGGGAQLSDVWTLSTANGLDGSSAWTQLTVSSGPVGRRGHVAAYDPATNRMIVFGGALATGGLGNDVWVLTNANGQGAPATWFQLLPSGSPPSPRRYLQGFFDAHTNRLILFGGETEGTVTNNEVWVLTNANGLGGSPAWIQLTPSGSPPSPRAVYAGAYDPGSNCFMVFGGSQYYSYSQGLNDYWVLKNANGLSGSPTWIEVFQDGLAGLPPPRTYSSMIYDLSSNRAVLFGGYSPGCGDNDPCTNSKQNDVWVLNNANVSDVETPQWNQVFPAGVQPQPRAVGTGAAYDPTSDRMMIFGGGITPVLNDTWILANATGRLASNHSTSDSTTIDSSSVPDLTISKSHTDNFTLGQTGATYTITVTNRGSGSTTGAVTVTDSLPTGLTATNLTGTGWSCALATLTCTRSDALAAGGSYPLITLAVNVASNASASVTNTATASGGGESNTGNDSASDVTTIAPVIAPGDLALNKLATQSSTLSGVAFDGASDAVDGNTDGNFYDGSVTHTNVENNAWWQVDLGASAAVNSVTVWNRTDCCSDRLADYWVFVSNTPFSSTDTPATLQSRAGTWSNHQTSAPNPSTTVSVLGSHGQYVRVQLDGTNYLSLAEVQVMGAIDVSPNPDLTIAKTHVGNFTQGQTGAAYTITVTNSGTAPTTGTVTVIDTLPPILTATDISGTGWSCTLGTLTCTRNDALAAGTSYPVITLTVNVAPTNAIYVAYDYPALNGTGPNLGNQAWGGALGMDFNVNSPINVLTLGAFDSGHDGLANAITVSLYDRTNQAAPVASLILNPSDPGLISIDSGLYLSLPAPLSLPAGFLGTIVAYGYSTNEPNGNRNEGANFNAATLDTGGGSIAYLNSSPFGAGTGYPNEPFDGFNNEFGAGSFTFSPATNAAASVINSVSVSGGGEQNTANDTATDVTIITPAVGPDLTITKSHASNFTQGQTGAIYTVAVMNSGTGPTTGTVTVTDSLPTGLTATNLTGTGWTCALATLTCSRSDALAAAGSYPAITLTVNVASNAPASVTNTAVVSGGGETNISNDLASDPTTITSSSLPDLTITKSHAGNFMQGQSGGTYTITVTNSGTASTIGTVIVADALPAGLAASGLSGTGWSCALGTLTCTRSDALAATTSYPAITLTINVASDAQASVTNTATVSGGGEMNTSNDTASDVTSITPPATCLTPPAGLVSWWPGDGNTSDLQGANDPSASNAVTFVPGQVGTGFTFGAGGYIDIPASPSLANQQFTLAAWVRPDGPGPNNDAFGSWIVGQDFDNTHAVYLYWRATDNHFGFEFGSQSSEAIVSQDSFPIGPFYLVTGSYDGTTFKLYVNGTLEGQLTETTSIPYTTNTWTIGSSPANIRNQGYPRTWNGVIDEVQVFDRAIGLGEIQTVFASGSVGECKPSSTTPDLTITKTHVGNFVLGQNGAVYTITVGNAGLALSVGTVSVVDAFPAGLTPVTIGGAGWTCALGTLACTRSDALAPAASYPPITLTVNVSPSAPAQVTNTATVSGGDEQNLANDVANDQTTIITAPPVLTVLSGDAQFGTVGQALGSPLIVKYASADGVALVGVPVTFSVTAGGGSLNGASPQVVVNTNAQGVASANLILGPIPGVNTVQATTSTSVVVSFGATGVGAITLTSGNNQVAAAGTALANPFVVTVVGAAGPLANIAVNFAATGGGGSLSASSVNTDTLGHASAILTLGPSAGSNIVTASVDGLIGSPITFTAAGQPLLGIAASPNPLSFGDVPIFASSTQAVTLTNTGQNPVTVTSITIAGNYFSLANLATLPLAIPPSGSTIFNVVFSPNATIPASATVSIASAATTSPISVLVSGNGTPPASPAPNLVTVATDQTAYRRGQPVKISGTATAADGTGIRNIPVQVQVALNGSARTLSPYTDFQGSFQTVFMPTAADGGTFSVTATASSKSITKTAGAAFRIAGLLVNPNSVTQDQVTGTTSTIPLDLQNIGDSQLTNVTFAATVTPAGAMTATFPQSISTLSTGGPITIPVSLTAPAGDPPAMPVSVQVQISATDPQSGLVDTETVPMTITLRPAVSTPVLLPSPIHLGVNPGKSLSVNLYVRNDGYLPMTNAAVALQNAGSNNWVSLGNANLGTVNHGDLRQFQLDVNPPANVALGDYQFNLSITGGTSPVQGSFIVTVTQLTVGNAAFAVNDDTGSTVGGATVTLYGTTNGKQFSMMTASDGTVTIPGVDAGDYTYVVAADSHDPYSGSVTVLPNATVSTGVILSYEVVSLTFTVTPTTIVDQYNVSLYITYSTTLPKPALQVVPYSMQLSFFPEDLTNGKYACKVNVTNTHPTASVRNLFLDASQLDVAQPAGQQIHVFFADGVQTYQVGVLAGKASVDVPCYATIDSGTIPSHSVGNIVVQANYDYSLQGQVLQGTTTTNVPVSYIRPSELQYDPIPFVYDKKTDPANPVLRYDAGGYLYTVKSNRNIPINLLQPAGVPFNGNNLVAFVQTQAGASDLETINANQANSFWHTNFSSLKQSLLASGDSTTFDISTLDAGLTLEQAISAQIAMNPAATLNLPTYLGFEGQWSDTSSPTGYLIPVRITTIAPDSITVPQPPSGGGPSTGCLNISDPVCKDPSDTGGGPAPASGDGQILLVIDQTIKLEREAYNAMLGIGARAALSNVFAAVHITDANGADASSKFFVLVTADPMGATHGGTVSGQAGVSWQLIPSASAGGTSSSGQQYRVQATLNYVVKGVAKMAMTQVVTITVLPAPKLTVAYSVPFVVMPGKDAFVRVTVQNIGLGTARNLSIVSMQPRVVGCIPTYPIDPLQDNPCPQVAFTLTGSSNTGDSSGFQAGNLTVNFGIVPPGGTVSGYWTLQVSQKGFFIDISSTFKHQDYQGIQLDPLVLPPTTTLVPAIGGTVTASGGQPVPNVTVTLLQTDKAVVTDTTDIAGDYYIPDLVPGSYLEQLTDIAGNILETQSVVVLPDQGTNFIDIALQNYNPTEALVVVNSNPAGLSLMADGDSYTTPHSFAWVIGSTHTLTAGSTSASSSSAAAKALQASAAASTDTPQQSFQGWGDGETSPTRVVTVTAFGAVYQALTTPSDSGKQYTKIAITPDPSVPGDDATDHKWPSINNRGDMVWSQKVNGTWQIFEQGPSTQNQRIPITSDNHNHERPVISDDGTIAWFQDSTGGGLGYAIVRRDPGSQATSQIEFSSRKLCQPIYDSNGNPVLSPCSSQEHDAGKNFGISSDGRTISYFTFYNNGDATDQPLDINGQALTDASGNKIEFFGYDSPDVNAGSALVYSDDFRGAGNVYLASLAAPLSSTTIDGPANPQQTGGPLPVPGVNQAVPAPLAQYPHVADGTKPEIAYIREKANVTHWPGKDPARWVDIGLWADIAGSGSNAKIIYEKVVKGYSQVFVATPVSYNLGIHAGDGQTSEVGATEPNPLSVLVMDQDGHPAPGVSISFAVTGQPQGASLGSLTATTVTTASDGTASTQLILGNQPGVYQVTASCASCSPANVTFTETATKLLSLAFCDSNSVLCGDDQVGKVYQMLADKLIVKVVDEMGAPASGVTVAFLVIQIPTGSIGASVTPVKTITGADGTAAAQFLIGSKAGQYEISAACGCTPNSITFTEHGVGERVITLRQLGNTRIISSTQYSEDVALLAEVKFPPGDPQAGQVDSGFSGQITFEEDLATSYYTDVNYIGNPSPCAVPAKLPCTVSADHGTAVVSLSSLSDCDQTTCDQATLKPKPALIKADASPIAIPDPSNGNPFSVQQWVSDNTGAVAWMHQHAIDILAEAHLNFNSEVNAAASSVASIGQDNNPLTCGETTFADISINPICLGHRLNVGGEFANTVLHEARHAWQYLQTLKSGNDKDMDELVEVADFPTPIGTPAALTLPAPALPYNLIEERGAAICCGGSGSDLIVDPYLIVVGHAIEKDAEDFALTYQSFFP